MSEADPVTFRAVVVAPTYRNAHLLPAVLAALADTGLPVLAIDDGSDDDTANVLNRWRDDDAGRRVITHAVNRGKAAALRTGFARARELGFTHALTIDTDGQHDVADVAPLLDLARRHPDALFVGARPTATPGYPLASRIGRAISNFFVHLESGARVSDSQCGLRVYPLDAVARSGATAGRYGYETEVLTRLAWAGVGVGETPIRCVYDVAGGRVSHFRPFRDSLQATAIHVRLLTRSFLPWPARKIAPRPPEGYATGTIAERVGRWINPLTVWRQVRREAAARERLAASMAVGIFIATIPAYGLKTILCLLTSKWMRLQPLVVLAVSSLNTPPAGVLLAAASIATGHRLLHGTLPAPGRYDSFRHGVWPTLRLVAAEWVLGSIVVGGVLALLTYGVVRFTMRAIPLAGVRATSRI